MKKMQRYFASLKPLSMLLLSGLVAAWLFGPTAMPHFVESHFASVIPSVNTLAASPQDNIAVALKFYEVYNDRTKIGLLSEIFAPNYGGVVNGRKIPNVQAAKGFVLAFLDAFPDANYVVEDVIATGDRVVVRWDCTATHRGSFLGINPTNQPIEVTGITIFQLANGKITRLWNNWDTHGLLQQLRSAG